MIRGGSSSTRWPAMRSVVHLTYRPLPTFFSPQTSICYRIVFCHFTLLTFYFNNLPDSLLINKVFVSFYNRYHSRLLYWLLTHATLLATSVIRTQDTQHSPGAPSLCVIPADLSRSSPSRSFLRLWLRCCEYHKYYHLAAITSRHVTSEAKLVTSGFK